MNIIQNLVRALELVLVVEGKKALDMLLKEFSSAVETCNEKLRRKGANLYLRKRHVVFSKGKKYVYFRTYWYRWSYVDDGGTRKLKWIYVGKNPPDDFADEDAMACFKHVEKNPLRNVRFEVLPNNDVLLSKEDFFRLKRFFSGFRAFLVRPIE